MIWSLFDWDVPDWEIGTVLVLLEDGMPGTMDGSALGID